MAQLYLDHNVARRVGELLQGGGHDVLASRDIQSERLSDDVLLLATVRFHRIFVTHNRGDFKLLHDAWVTWPAAFGIALPSHPGILVLDAGSPDTLAEIVADFLDAVHLDALLDAIFWWHRRDGWHRATGGGPWVPYQLSDDAERE
ncbi:MAG: DUF5615 family PIN-like protein [Chloroflexi bacterium]|nr:DUF5615 family PIN-like protein [Chloroflexota bacterium]